MSKRKFKTDGINYMITKYEESCDTYDIEALQDLFYTLHSFHTTSKLNEDPFKGMDMKQFLKTITMEDIPIWYPSARPRIVSVDNFDLVGDEDVVFHVMAAAPDEIDDIQLKRASMDTINKITDAKRQTEFLNCLRAYIVTTSDMTPRKRITFGRIFNKKCLWIK